MSKKNTGLSLFGAYMLQTVSLLTGLSICSNSHAKICPSLSLAVWTTRYCSDFLINIAVPHAELVPCE